MSDKDDVRKIITPIREAKIYRAFHQAWTDWVQDRARYSRWPRTRANMFFERLAIRLQEQFADDPGFHFTFHNETVKIVVDQKLLARCKKADGRGLGHNIQTGANDLFCDQASLSIVVPFDKVEIVYVVNKLGTEISKVLVQPAMVRRDCGPTRSMIRHWPPLPPSPRFRLPLRRWCPTPPIWCSRAISLPLRKTKKSNNGRVCE